MPPLIGCILQIVIGLVMVPVPVPGMLYAPQGKPKEITTTSRPGPEDEPTEVAVGLFLIDLAKINDVDRSFTADIHVALSWKDPRLAQASDGVEGRVRRYRLHDLWHPRVAILNQRSVSEDFENIVEVDPEGYALYRQRYYGEFSFYSDLRDFPLDRHTLAISLVARGYSPEEVRFAVEGSGTGAADKLSIAGWTIGPIGSEVRPFRPATLNRTLSSIQFSFEAERRIGYYLWKVIGPLTLIVFMSWTVFWIDPSQLGPQIGVSTASMFTLVAYQFIIGNTLPRISYLTRVDYFLLCSQAIVFLALVQAITTGYISKRMSEELARKIDRLARWVFPIAFAGCTTLIFLK